MLSYYGLADSFPGPLVLPFTILEQNNGMIV